MEIEIHPLEPFLPAKSKLLMLGSFPPQKKRWSMEFYYPNLINPEKPDVPLNKNDAFQKVQKRHVQEKR